MSKRSVKVNAFFPKRIFAPDIWGAETESGEIQEFDEHNIVSKFAAKTIPSSNSFSTRGQKYASNEQNEFGYIGNYTDEAPQTPIYRAALKTNYDFPQKPHEHSFATSTFSDVAPLSASLPQRQSHEILNYQHDKDAERTDEKVLAFEQSELDNEYVLRQQDIGNDPFITHQALTTTDLNPSINYEPNFTEEQPIVQLEPILEQSYIEYDVQDTNQDVPNAYEDIFNYQNQFPNSTFPIDTANQIPISDYEHLMAPSEVSQQMVEEVNNDFDYSMFRGNEVHDTKNNTLQFENNDFVTSKIKVAQDEEREQSKNFTELVLNYKKEILIIIASIVFILCTAVLYIGFTSSSDSKSIPVPTNLKTGTSNEKPVIIVPSQNDAGNQPTLDQNGNPIGQ